MLDPNLMRDNPERVRAALERRGADAAPFEKWLELDRQYRTALRDLERMRAEHKQASNQADREIGRQRAQAIAAREPELNRITAEARDLALRIPNVPHPSVTTGKTSDDNVCVKTWGTKPRFDFTPRPNWELIESLGAVDMARGAKLACARYPLYKGQGALMEWGLMHDLLQLHVVEHGYTPWIPPFFVNHATAEAAGSLPKFAGDLFRTDDNFYLIPTAEVPLVNIHMDEILSADQLPKRYVAYTPCFRREAGSGGRDQRGIMRVVQFNKVELVNLTTPESSYDFHEAMLAQACAVLERYGLHYRVMLLCAGDMGFAAAKTYDIEVWMPGQGEYREISSVSNCEDFQTRRANLRYRPEVGARTRLVHGLNGSGVAIGRLHAAILENCQRADGSVVVPEPLRPYVHADTLAAAEAVAA